MTRNSSGSPPNQPMPKAFHTPDLTLVLQVALNQSIKGVTGLGADLKAINERLNRLVKRIDDKVKTLIEASKTNLNQVT